MKRFQSVVASAAAVAAMCLITPALAIDFVAKGETLTCESARAYMKDDAAMVALPPDEQDLVLLKHRICLTDLYNAANPDNPQSVFVTRSAAPEGQKSRYFFETIAKNDFEHLHEACVITGVASGAIISGTVVADIGQNGYFEWASKVGCAGLMDGLAQNNLFVLTAPVTMAHLALAKDILKKNGGLLGEIYTFSEKVEAEYKRVAEKAKDAGQDLIDSVRGCLGLC